MKRLAQRRRGAKGSKDSWIIGTAGAAPHWDRRLSSRPAAGAAHWDRRLSSRPAVGVCDTLV